LYTNFDKIISKRYKIALKKLSGVVVLACPEDYTERDEREWNYRSKWVMENIIRIKLTFVLGKVGMGK
jgi:hypothetical protein